MGYNETPTYMEITMFNTITENARNFRAAHPVAVDTLKSAWVVAVTASAVAVAIDTANRVNNPTY